MKTIKVMFLVSEADPLVKVGGLGDVGGSLPQTLRMLSPEMTAGDTLDARLVIPFHSALRKKITPTHLFDFEVPSTDGSLQAQAYQYDLNGVPTYLIGGGPFLDDGPIYNTDTNIDGVKFFFFSLAALGLAKKLDWQPDILHANDWHTALAVYALKLAQQTDPFFRGTRSILSVHNLPFMGAGTEAAFDFFNMPASQDPLLPWWAKKFPLPLAMQTADRIIAVSSTYAKEILTPDYGCGLETFLQSRQESVMGIVNGLDMSAWDPATDANLPVNFSATTLKKRVLNKQALAEEFSLNPDPAIPLLILISRMDQQKGVDLALESLNQLAGQNWQAILLGTGDPRLEAACQALETSFPDRVRAAIRFDAKLSRRMYAGADVLLMPSRYEPCGLAQMMAMRYGCLPLARATGGLQDTIVDVSQSPRKGTGFLFKPATADAFSETLQRALDLFPDKKHWTAVQKKGMGQDFSWQKSALQYVQVYQQLLG